jgi:transposase, IS30 family
MLPIAWPHKVYFAYPYCSWERGLNENTNGLLRQNLPKSTDLSGYSQEQLDEIADRINCRPRKTLGWCTPLEVYGKWLARLETQPDAVH